MTSIGGRRGRATGDMARVLALCGLGLLPVTASSRLATAQTSKSPDKTRLATEAFKACREQQKIGDASACYRLWLTKWKEYGSEAESAYAEEHAVAPAPAQPREEATSPPAVVPTPSRETVAQGFVTLRSTNAYSKVEIDGVLAPANLDHIPLSPGEHTVRATGTGITPAERRLTVKAGETTVLDLTPPRGAADVPPAATGEVLDFCALKPKSEQETGRSSKKRVVVYSIAGSSAIEDDGQVKKVAGGSELRAVLAGRLPLQRFHNVIANASAPDGWEARETISVDELASLSSAREDPSAEKNGNAAEDEFVRYSLRCADYVALPAVTGHAAKWEEQQVKDSQGNTRVVRTLKLEVAARLGIFKRDAGTLRRIALLDASVPSLVDSATDMASMTAAAASSSVSVGGRDMLSMVDTAKELPSYVSAVPDLGCLASKAATDGVAGLVACGPKGSGSVEAAAGNVDERLGPICRQAMRGQGDTSALMVRCEVRARAFQLARALQKQARAVDGWRLFGVLSTSRGRPEFALGRAEGIRVGYVFQVVRGDDRLGFYKVTDVGPGGEAGEAQHTALSKRGGDSPEGSRLEEWPQSGIVVQPFASIGLSTINYGRTVIYDSSKGVIYEPPKVLFGGGIRVGYDLSSALSWPETYVRVSGGAYYGRGTGTSVQAFPVEIFFEKGLYLGPRLMVSAAVGGGIQFVSMKFMQGSTLPSEANASAIVGGPSARVGFSYSLHPDWTLDLEGIGRFPVSRASYSVDGDQSAVADIQRRKDFFAFIGGSLGVTKVF